MEYEFWLNVETYKPSIYQNQICTPPRSLSYITKSVDFILW